MKILFDTPAFLWYVLNDPNLSDAGQAVVDEADVAWISPASYWEIAIKITMGKYTLTLPFENFW